MSIKLTPAVVSAAGYLVGMILDQRRIEAYALDTFDPNDPPFIDGTLRGFVGYWPENVFESTVRITTVSGMEWEQPFDTLLDHMLSEDVHFKGWDWKS